jgi:hypothetical protein
MVLIRTKRTIIQVRKVRFKYFKSIIIFFKYNINNLYELTGKSYFIILQLVPFVLIVTIQMVRFCKIFIIRLLY